MIRPRLDVRALRDEVRAFRACRAAKAKAERYVALADTLSTQYLLGPRHRQAEARARRLYRAVARSLPQDTTATSGSGSDARADAFDRLDAARRRTRAAALRSLVLGLPWLTLAAALIALIVTQVPPIKRYVSPQNISVGHPWRTSGPSFGGAPTQGKLPRTFDHPFFFHTAELDGPWLQIDLEQERTIDRFVVKNRADCCFERGLPLVAETSVDGANWDLIARRRGLFSRWDHEFPARRARYVRFRAERTTSLHFQSVKVY